MKNKINRDTKVYYGGYVTKKLSSTESRVYELFIQISKHAFAIVIPQTYGLLYTVKFYPSPKNFEKNDNYPIAEGRICFDPGSQDLTVSLDLDDDLSRSLKKDSFYRRIFLLMEKFAIEHFPEAQNLVAQVPAGELDGSNREDPSQYADFYKHAGYQPTARPEHFVKPVSTLRKIVVPDRVKVVGAKPASSKNRLPAKNSLESLS